MKKITALALLLTCCFCLLAYADGEYEYAERQYIAFTEPNGFERFNSQPGFIAHAHGNDYAFAHNIEVALRDDCIDKTHSLLQFYAAYGASTQKYKIVIVSKTYPARVEEKTLYVGYDAIGTTAYAVGIAKLCFGNDVPYGLLYGLAALAMESVFDEKEQLLPVEEALKILDPAYLDMNYACFIEPYATQETIDCMRSVACDFVASLSQDCLNKLVHSQNHQRMYAALYDYLKVYDYQTHDFSYLNQITVHGGGNAIRLVIEGEYASYHVQYDFHDYAAGEGIYPNPLNGSYLELRETILSLERHIALIREVFRDFELPERVQILFQDTRTYYGHEGAYTAERISLGSIVGVAHEYVHSVVTPYGAIEPWVNEVLAYYYGSTPAASDDKHYMDYWTQYAQHCYENNELDPQTTSLISEALAASQMPMDAFKRETHVAVGHHIAHHDNKRIQAVKSITSGLGAKYSFYEYLLSCYAESAVLQAAISNKPEELLGASWESLLQAWSRWLETDKADE